MSLQAQPPEYPQIYDTFQNFISSWTGRTVTYEMVSGDVYSAYISCGVSLLSGVQISPQSIVDKILKERNNMDQKKIKEAFVIFSDIVRTEGCFGGEALYKYIKDKDLGQISEFGPRMNPNTGNMIKLWVWCPPHASLEPKDKFMPVHGKILKLNNKGILSIYEDDPRFKARTREA